MHSPHGQFNHWKQFILNHAMENRANKNTGKLLFMYIQWTGITSDLPIMHWAYVVFMYFLGCYKTVMQSSAVVHVHHGISHLSLVFFGIHTSSTLLGKYK